MYIVNLLPFSPSASKMGSWITAGLYELEAQGLVSLELTRVNPAQMPLDERYVWLTLSTPGKSQPLKVCFDLIDESAFDANRLAAADVYFKRSYSEAVVLRLTALQQAKVRSIGLDLPCRSPLETFGQRFRRIVYRQRAQNRYGGRASLIALHAVAQTARDLFWPPTRAQLPLPISDLEERPDSHRSDEVLFSTRVYAPTDAPNAFRNGTLPQLNETRAAVVRALRAEFGDRFRGGLVHSDYARKQYPDCLSAAPISHLEQIGLTRRVLVNVTTSGPHGCIGWKAGEVVAAAGCLVAEPFPNSLPVPLIDGQNYLSFRSPDECVNACVRLTEDPSLAQAMRERNHAYYQQHTRPDRLVLSCLKRAVGPHRMPDAHGPAKATTFASAEL